MADDREKVIESTATNTDAANALDRRSGESDRAFLDERFSDRDVASKAADAPRGPVRTPMPPLREDEEPYGPRDVARRFLETAGELGERVKTNLTRITRIGRQANPPETGQ